jgi:hypothetical protein
LKCDEGTVTEIKWTIPGKTFKDYSASWTTGTLTKLGASDLDDLTVTFYWANTGENREVTVRFKLDGMLCEETVTLSVKGLAVSIGPNHDPPPMGTTQLNEAKDTVGVFPIPGIIFKAKVKVPPGFMAGEWHFVQVVLPDRTLKVAATGKCFSYRSTEIVIDTNYPYSPPPYASPTSPPGSHSTGDTFHTTDDTPMNKLLLTRSQNVGSDIFGMYIMFKPAGVNSKWVPLRRVVWSWTYCCTNTDGTWTLDEKGQTTTNWKVTSNHPVWNGNVAHLPPNEVTCPPACKQP